MPPITPPIIPPPIRKHLPWLLVVALIGTAAIGWGMSGFGTVAQTTPTACGLANPAFCEPWTAPNPRGDRAGNLNGVLWGVSRATNNSTPGGNGLNAWAASTLTACGSSQTVQPETDNAICNGLMADSVNDVGSTDLWAAYPRQPFDIAGRTGKVTFDVGDDTRGTHEAWPAFVYTDQPVPAPNGGGGSPAVSDDPRNSIGFSLAQGGQSCSGCPSVGVDNMWTTTNYAPSRLNFSADGSVLEPTAAQIAAGQLNHFEVDINASSITVLGSDPGSSTLRQVAHVSGITVPLSRGLVWIEDVHYNACKGGEAGCQGNHTLIWGPVGFDGPLLPRDLGFDVLDARRQINTLGGFAFLNLGYNAPATVQTIADMTSANIAAASGALLEFTWFAFAPQPVVYSINGHASHSVPWPYPGNPIWVSETLAVPVDLAELQPGANTITFGMNGVSISNIDIILAGAGGIVAPSGTTPIPTAVTTVAPTSTAAATIAPANTATSMPPSATPVPATTTAIPATASPVASDTPVPTDTPIPTSTLPPTVASTPASLVSVPPPPAAGCFILGSQDGQFVWRAC